MPHPKVTVAIPTLAEDETLAECLRALESQTFQDFEAVVIDNSGTGRARITGPRVRTIVNSRNLGFGEAINQAYRLTASTYLAALNDDAEPAPQWLERLVACADAHPRAGMFASEVHLGATGLLDSAGMLIAADGSSTQRGHGEAASSFAHSTSALYPSGSAALYRRVMLEEIGLFDEQYFLYCEDTDLGLRARWAGWDCLYVPGAVVRHRYSRSAGRASPLKAYYVERNRIATVWKNFPMRLLWRAPFAAAARYGWHLASIFEGKGKAAEFRAGGQPAWLLPWIVVRAHTAALVRLPRLLRMRRKILSSRKIQPAQFAELLAKHSVTLRDVASH